MTTEPRAVAKRRWFRVLIASMFTFSAVLVLTGSPPGATPTITRIPVAASMDDAWQRGDTTLEYAMQPDDTIVYLGRSNSPDMKMKGGWRFATGLAANTVVKAAFIQGLNNFGQQLTVFFYGDLTAGAPNFDAANPTIIDRSHTSTVVPWNQQSLQNGKAVSSPDLAPIINALDVLPGWNGTVVLLAIAGSGSDQSIDIRSFEHAPGPGATLELQT